MNDEYRRPEAEAIEVEAKIACLIGAAGAAPDADSVQLKAELRLLHQRLEGLRQGMRLIRRAEPRLFMIDAVDEHGRLDPKFAPVIDGTLGSCDLLFRLLLS